MQHKVTDLVRQVLPLWPQAPVAPVDQYICAAAVHAAQPDRTGGQSAQATTAGAGVDALAKALVRHALGGECGVNFTPAAAAGVGPARPDQPGQRGGIQRAAP